MSWVPCRLSHVLVEEHHDNHAIYLREIDGPRLLTIAIGPLEAGAIRRGVADERFARPLTHDLIVGLLEVTGRRCSGVRIEALEQGTYYASLLLADADGTETAIDCRPSDAIAILVRLSDVPLLVADEVFTDADA